MPLRTDNDVIVHGNAHPFAGISNLARDRNVLLTWLRRAAGVIVDLSAFSEIDMIINMLQ